MKDDVILPRAVAEEIRHALSAAVSLAIQMEQSGTLIDAKLAHLYVETNEKCREALGHLSFEIYGPTIWQTLPAENI